MSLKIGKQSLSMAKQTSPYVKRHYTFTLPGSGSIQALVKNGGWDLLGEVVRGEKTPRAMRIVIDFGGSRNPETKIHLIFPKENASLPSPFAQDWGRSNDPNFPILSPTLSSWEDFSSHNAYNILYHIAHRLTTLYKFITSLSQHYTSSNANFAVREDGNPKASKHSLFIAMGFFSCASFLPEEIWNNLGIVMQTEIVRITATGLDIDTAGYRIIINNGPKVQSVGQMHAHLLAGYSSPLPILPSDIVPSE